MKYILLTLSSFLVFFSSGVQSFAQDMIDVSVSQENITTAESFTLNIDVKSQDIGQKQTNFQIPGIENFEVFSQSQSLSVQNINGATQSILRYSIALTALQAGTYSLGPVQIGEGTGAIVDDVIFSIAVQDTNTSLLPKNNVSSNSTIQNTSDKQQQVRDEIRGLRTPNSLIWALLFAALGFGIFGFLVFQKILSQKHTQILESTLLPEIPDNTLSDKEFFSDLAHKVTTLSSQEFLQIYNMKLREIFLRVGVSFAQTATLAEMKNEILLKNNPMFSLFEKSYIAEYKLEELSGEDMRDYILQVTKLL